MIRERLREYWQSLSQREKGLLLTGLAVLGLVFYWQFLYQPLTRAVASAEQRNQAMITQWQWMQQQLPLVKNNPARAPTTIRDPSVPFMTWLDEQLASAQLQTYVKRLEPVDDNRVTLWLEQVPFEPLMRWLQALQQGQGVLVSEFDAMPLAATPGLSTVRLTLYQP